MSTLKLHIALTLLTLALLSLSPTAAAIEVGNTTYVTDELRIPLRSGPTTGYRIINYLPAGTKMTVLTVSNDFAEIRTERGTQGWVESSNLRTTPIARDRLAAAEAEARRAKGQYDKLRSDLANARESGSASANQSAALQVRVNELESELAEIRRISADAIAANDARAKLTELNQRLRNEIEKIQDENVRLHDNTQQRWMLIGAGLLLLGLIIGFMVKARPRRSGWS